MVTFGHLCSGGTNSQTSKYLFPCRTRSGRSSAQIIGLVTALCGTLSFTLHYPVWNMFFVWTLIILAGTVVVVIIIIFFFQFITADLQSFIYFQF